jgi:PAS domain S-box-containing protein
MISPTISIDEQNRINSLKSYRILDTLPEKEYDNITKLASMICETPISLVSLIDENRQVFKSRTGIDIPHTDRDIAFCNITIQQPHEITVINDARNDTRFNSNPLVYESPNVIFYAGYPLVNKDGFVLGSLCVIDNKPGKLKQKQIDALQYLASQVVQLLELHKKSIELEQSKLEINAKSERFENILEATNTGIWEWDMTSGDIQINHKWAEIIGYQYEELIPFTTDKWQSLIHPGDFKIVEQEILECIENNLDRYDCAYRMMHKEGNWIWIQARGKVINFKPNKEQDSYIVFGTHSDINKRKINEAQLQLIADNLPAVMFRYRLNSDGTERLIHASKATEILMGYKPELLIANINLYWEQIYPEDLPSLKNSIFTSAKHLEHWKHEWRAYHPDGTLRWHRGRGIPTSIGNGDIIWDSIILDITDEKKTTDEVIITNRKLNKAQEIANLGNWEYNQSTKEFIWSKQLNKIWRGNLENTPPTLKSILTSIHPEDRFLFRTNYKMLYSQGEELIFEHRLIPNNNINTWVQHHVKISLSPVTNSKILEGTIQDITAQKNDSLKLQENINRFKYATRATSDVIWDWNIKTNELKWGDNFERNFGYESLTPDLNLKLWEDNIHPNDKETVISSFYSLKNNKDCNWTKEYRFKKNDGSYANILDRGFVIRNNSGEVIQVIGAMQDITERKAYECSLEKLNRHLEGKTKQLIQSNTELEQFAYVASHDLQEPLRMVTSFLNLLDQKYDSVLDDKGKTYINFAVDGAKRMRKIILDLLDYSRVGRFDDKLENINTNEVIEEIKLLFKQQISSTAAQITYTPLPKINFYRTPLILIFQNLIGNALKYSREDVPPKINIIVEEKADHWVFTVSDNGIGIAEEYYDKIFLIFHRLHNRDEYSGTGMGLAITKKIIESLGGNITVKSQINIGSKFTFSIMK